MKIVAIGDIHGRTSWMKIMEKEKDADKIIFIGDYFDSRENISVQEQVRNFMNITNFAYNNDKVVLLLGNHDIHLLPRWQEQYSGFNPITKLIMQEQLQTMINEGHIIACYEQDGFLFSHAGVSQTWWNENVKTDEHSESVSCDINLTLVNEPEIFGFYKGDISGSGNNIHQSPIWIRPEALNEDMLEGRWRQVVGHTQQEYIDVEDSLILIDALASGQYLIINDRKPKVGFIN